MRKLVERGDEVKALVRPTSNRMLLEGLPVRAVIGDLRQPESYAEHLDGIDQLYHVAADYRLWARDPNEIYRSNVDGTRAILQAALERGVAKVVYTSTVGCLGLPKDGAPGTETTPVVRDELVGHYKKSKYDAEQVALEYTGRGLNIVIVNPSTPVGPGDIKPTPTGKIILDFLRGKMPAYVDTGMNLVAVEDVAQGHLLAAEKGCAGEKYILGNRNLTLREILGILSEIIGRKPPRVRIPHAVALAAALVDAARSRISGAEPAIPLEGVLMARKKMYFSAEKAVRELGLSQTPVQDALAGAVRWFEDHGYVTLNLIQGQCGWRHGRGEGFGPR